MLSKKNTIITLILAIIVHAIGIGYFLIFKQYFQQDEWHSFGLILSQRENYVFLQKPILELLLGDRVGARIITFFLFNTFGLHSFYYGLLAFLYHCINTFLVYLLGKKLSQSKIVGLLAGLFFLVNEVGNEAYSWFGTMNGSATSVMLFLISLLLFLYYIDTQKYRYIFYSVVALWISLLFKEISLFAFVIYPIIFAFYNKKRGSFVSFLKSYVPFLVFGSIMFAFFIKNILFLEGDPANYVTSGNSFLSTVFIHALQYPAEGIMEVFLPNAFIFSIGEAVLKVLPPGVIPETENLDVIIQNLLAEIILVIFLATSSAISVWQIKKHWKHMPHETKRGLIISFFLLLLSFIPYIVIYRSFSYLDSRHYYAATIGASIFLAMLLVMLFQNAKKPLRFGIVIVVLVYIFLHDNILLSDFTLFADRSHERQSFIHQITSLVPTLKDKTVFYITGNSEGYYGLTEVKTPFQSGTGHVLMTIYAMKNQLSPTFFEENSLREAYDVGFLYDILGQGYRERRNKGFGYYHDKNDLEKALQEKLFMKNDVISLYYNSNTQILERSKN